MRTLVSICACFGLFAVALADPRDFAVEAKPVFQCVNTWIGAPIAVEIENKGPDAQGQLLVSVDQETTRYPVELPTGSKKRILTFPASTPYGGMLEFVLDTDQGRFQIPYLNKGSYGYGNTTVVALISDTSGDLGFLRQVSGTNQEIPYLDAYCTPEDAPDRPIGYQGVGAVILGPGSERLPDGAVKAIQSYVMTGGTVIFIGGASATTLGDPRWANILPAQNFKTATVSNSQVLREISGRLFEDAITVSSGTPIASASTKSEKQVPMIAERGFGLGRSVLFAFNPFEEPMVRWEGRKKLFTSYARMLDYQRASSFLSQFGLQSDTYGGYGAPTPYGGQTDRKDPFSVQLPAPSKVFWILAAFFVTVVPINFFVLRKLGRGEWAWVSAPVISLVFAGIFLAQASALYSASLSTATRGVLISQQGMPESMFVGSTQIFFPNGGSYDLKMENVDQLGTGMNYESGYGYNQPNRTQMNPIDVGTVRVPSLRAANLAFEEIGYRQRIEKGPRIDVTSKPMSSSQVELTVKNQSTSTLSNAVIAVGGRRYPLNNLAPGASQQIRVHKSLTDQGDNQGDYLNGLTQRQNVAIVVADLTGVRPGPQIGQEVQERSGVRLVHIAPIAPGGIR